MSTDKRARQKANRASRVAEAEDAAARARLRSRVTTYGVGAAIVILAIVGIAILASDDDGPTTSDDAAGVATTTTAAPTTAPPPPGVSAPEPGASVQGATECPAEDGSSERTTTFTESPPMCIDETAVYTATVDTTYGEFTIELDASRAPLTVNNFIVLARYGYYDGAPFHRIIPGFVIQGGDAVGSPLGTGNPGYSIADELPAEGEYQVGSVAMANSARPDTGGSQFFVITGDSGVALPAQYSLFGEVTTGLEVVLQIEGTQTTLGDAPVDEIIINSVTVEQN